MMRPCLAMLALLLSLSAIASDRASTADAKGGKNRFALTLDKVPIQQLVMLYYDQCEERGLVFDPALDKLDQVLTIKTPSLSCTETRDILGDALARTGVTITNRGNYDVVTKLAERDGTEDWQQLIYRPLCRDAQE